MAKLLTVFLLTALSFATSWAAPFEITYSKQMGGAENFAFIDPLVDEVGQHVGFIYSDEANRKLIIEDFFADSLTTIGLSGAPVKTIHYYSSKHDTLYIYALLGQIGQMPKIAFVTIVGGQMAMTVQSANCNFGFGLLDKIERQDIRFERNDVGIPTGIWFEASLRYVEDMPGFGSSSETHSTTILYSLDLQRELLKEAFSSMKSGNFYGDKAREFFGYTNYDYGYDFRQSGDPAAVGELQLTTTIVRDSFDLRLSELTTPGGFSRGALVDNFEPADEFDEVIFFGKSEDLEGIMSDVTQHVSCYSFAGETVTWLWGIEDSLIELDHVYRDMRMVVGTKGNDRAVFIDYGDGQVVDSLNLGRELSAIDFFETYFSPSTLNLVGRSADTVFVYRFEISPRVYAATSNSSEQTPQNYTLHQNYPNPFNGETRLSFETDVSQYFVLKIYNILGQEVANLAQGLFSPGTYYAYWNGTDNAGMIQSTGIYFAKLQSDNSSQIIKLIFLK